MNQEISRRNLLKGAATLMTVPALAPFASTGHGGDSRYREPDGQNTPAAASSARSIEPFSVLLTTGKSPASLAVGATDKGIVYEGAFGKRDAAHGRPCRSTPSSGCCQ
jgi:hypothetical protein